MKKRIFARAFALFMALSLLSTTAFAADFIAEVMRPDQTRDQITDEQRYEDLQTAINAGGEGSTVYLLDDCTVSSPNYAGVLIGHDGQTLDLDDHTLTVTSDSLAPVVGVSNNNKSSTIQNGTIVVDAPNAVVVMGVTAVQGEVTLDNLTVEHAAGTSFEGGGAVANGQHEMTMTDCVVVDGPVLSMPSFSSGEPGNITINSGVYSELGVGTKLADDSTVFSDVDDDKASGLVVTNKDTAAVVVDENGKAKLYGDLAEAVKASNGAAVVVTDENALENLEVKEGDKLNLFDAEGNSLNDNVNLGDDLVLGEDGVVSAKPAEPVVDPGTGAVEPATPVTPVIPDNVIIPGTDMPLAGGSDTTAIADSEVPLAGLITRAQLVSYLYEHEGSPDGADAEGEYTLAMAWAVANEIVDEEDAPEEIVTVAILKDVMTNYAAYLDAAFDVAIEGEEDMVVMNCDEILAEFYASVEDPAA